MYGKWKFYNRSMTIVVCASEIRVKLEVVGSSGAMIGVGKIRREILRARFE